MALRLSPKLATLASLLPSLYFYPFGFGKFSSFDNANLLWSQSLSPFCKRPPSFGWPVDCSQDFYWKLSLLASRQILVSCCRISSQLFPLQIMFELPASLLIFGIFPLQTWRLLCQWSYDCFCTFVILRCMVQNIVNSFCSFSRTWSRDWILFWA